MVEVSSLLDLGYLVSATLFIFGIKMLGSPKTAPKGNMYGAVGMLVAVLNSNLTHINSNYKNSMFAHL